MGKREREILVSQPPACSKNTLPTVRSPSSMETPAHGPNWVKPKLDKARSGRILNRPKPHWAIDCLSAEAHVGLADVACDGI